MSEIANLQVVVGAEVESLRRGMADVQASVRGAGKALEGVKGSSKTANFAMIQFSRVAQDAAFGPVGVINNLEGLFDAFGKVRKEAEASGKSLARVLGAAIFSPAGALAAFSVASSAAIVFGDDLKKAFGLATSGAKEFKSVLGEILDVDLGFDKFVLKIEQIGEALNKLRLRSVGTRADAIRSGVGGTEGYAQNLFSDGAGGFLARLISPAVALFSNDQQRAAIRSAEAYRAVKGELEDLASKSAIYKDLAEILKEVGATESGDGKASAKAFEEAWRVRRLAIRRFVEEAKEVAGVTKLLDTSPLARTENALGRSVLAPPELRRTFSVIFELNNEMSDLEASIREVGVAAQFALGQGLRDSVDGIARGIGDAAAELVFGAERMSRAQEALTRLSFQESEARLRESLREGQITAERFRAEMAVLKEDMDAFALATSNTLTSRFRRAFATIVDTVRQAMRQVVAEINAAIARAAILEGIKFVLGGSKSGLANFVRGALGFSAPSAAPALAGPQRFSFEPVRIQSGELLIMVRQGLAEERARGGAGVL